MTVLFVAPGPLSSIERTSFRAGAHRRIAGPGWHTPTAALTSTGFWGTELGGQSGRRAISQMKHASSLATATATVVRRFPRRPSSITQRPERRS